jgi:hypothetical protein
VSRRSARRIPRRETRHLDASSQLARQPFRKLMGPEQRTWMLRLDAELENLLAAHR